MRDFKGIKRQRGRNRNGGGGGGGGGKPQHNTNRAFDSNGPDGVKVRGAAQHVYEKYQQLARDAQTSGDRVLAENYLQHAEHYFRLLRAMQPQRPLSEIIGRDQFVSGYDIDFEDESGAGEGAETESEAGDAGDGGQERSDSRQGEYRQNDFRQNDSRQNDGRQNDGRQGDYRQGNRDDRPREDRFAADRPQGDRGQNDRSARNGRDDRPRYNRDDRPRSDRGERASEEAPVRTDREPLNIVEPEATPLVDHTAVSSATPVLRADDGEINHAPAFLQVRPAEARGDGETEARRPRRRRPPRSFEADDASPAIADAEEG